MKGANRPVPEINSVDTGHADCEWKFWAAVFCFPRGTKGSDGQLFKEIVAAHI